MINDSKKIYEHILTFLDKPEVEELFLKYCRDVLSPVEALLYEFKAKIDNNTHILEPNLKLKFAEAVSGFANASGGVWILGVGDKTLEGHPITEPYKCLELLMQLSTTCVTPAVQEIAGRVINSKTEGKGYIVIHIPMSDLPPHQVILKDATVGHRYYYRTANSFLSMVHDQLANMFGKRQRAKLTLTLKNLNQQFGVGEQYIRATFSITNEGRALARNIYLCLSLCEPYVRALPDVHERAISGNGMYLVKDQSDYFAVGTYVAEWRSQFHEVIHPGQQFILSGLVLWPNWTDWSTNRPAKMQVDYALFCENCEVVRGKVPIDPAKRFT